MAQNGQLLRCASNVWRWNAWPFPAYHMKKVKALKDIQTSRHVITTNHSNVVSIKALHYIYVWRKKEFGP